ncbi:hypothetical protein P1S61_41035 [Streptomyces sp. ME08-AFT2]|uniref:hypothetical protein n=1 Tax=Streptomyces sp. ME08-AFT2 TaxID=3028683 RepID=UPI0029A40E2D|nr:hypothetical protein [Streptomyces sp. ME08-AFT2]MDX3315319.1 hypothetical protein [Streptomyces sp. ME08-AFT2]
MNPAADREEIVAEGARRMEAAALEAQRALGTEAQWAPLLEAERIRVEVEALTGVSLTEPVPARVLDLALAWAARAAGEQAEKFLEGIS